MLLSTTNGHFFGVVSKWKSYATQHGEKSKTGNELQITSYPCPKLPPYPKATKASPKQLINPFLFLAISSVGSHEVRWVPGYG